MAVVVLDDRLTQLVDPDVEVEKIATGYSFTEGPVWHASERHLTYSDIYDDHGGTMYRWTRESGAQVFRRPSNRANGNTYDRQGRLVTCQHNRGLVRQGLGGEIETLVERFGDARLNSPNDVICTANGDLIFTDPTYGLRQPDGSIVGQEYDFAGVFRYRESDGSLTLLIRDLDSPNGLAMPDDGSKLYVCDTTNQIIRAWDVASDGSLSGGDVLCTVKHGDSNSRPDGIKLDVHGNIYLAANSPEGLWVFAPDGTLLGFIGIGEEMNRTGTALGGPANLAWGDDDWQTLYVTAVSSVYRLRMKVAGQPVRLS